MALPAKELKRRIEAARALRGLDQVELGRRFAEDGLGRHDVGRIERGELALQRVHIDALIRHLAMPEWWFTAEQIELPDQHEDADQVRGQLEEIRTRLEELLAERGTEPQPGPVQPEALTDAVTAAMEKWQAERERAPVPTGEAKRRGSR